MKRLYSLSLSLGLMVAAFSWLGASLAPAAVDYYLKIDGIPGESTDLAHRGWIELESFSHGMSRAASYGTPGIERSTLGDIVVTKRVDKASPQLFLALLGGQVITSATIELRRTYGLTATPQPYLQYRLKDFIVTSYQTSAKGEGELGPAESYRHMEEVSFVYRKIEWVYIERNPDTGQPVAQVTGGWNAAEDKPISVVPPGRAMLTK